MQKQMLWHTFQEKNKQLELQHKWQLEHKFQVCNALVRFDIKRHENGEIENNNIFKTIGKNPFEMENSTKANKYNSMLFV